MSDVCSPCGADCFSCDKFPDECSGCFKIKGKVWWTEFTDDDICGIYNCCVNKNRFADCGKCDIFPCVMFRQGDPTKSDEENREILAKQVMSLKN